MLTVILVRAKLPIQAVKLGSAVVYVLRPILQNVYITRKYHLDKRCEPDMSALKKRGDAMAHALANIVHDHTDLIVLTLFTGVKTVSVYTVYNMVVSGLKKIQSIFTTGTEPIFGNMWVKKEYAGIRYNLGIYEYFVSAYSAVVYTVAAVMILPFISIYVKNVTDIEYIRPAYAFVIILAFVILSFRTPYVALVHGVGHYRETRAAAIWEAVINLGLSVLLVLLIREPNLKMVGVAIGTLAANLFRTCQYAVYIDNHIVKRGKHVFILKILWTLVNMLIVTVPGYLYVRTLEIHSWIKWGLISAVVAVISAAVVLISSLIFYRRDMLGALKVARRMIKKFIPGR